MSELNEVNEVNEVSEGSGPILFYSTSDAYGCFSNFYKSPIRLGGKTWPTVEHYFQAQKFEDAGHREEIRKANTPMIAARMGRDRKKKLRRDWESAKVNVMMEGVRAKFTQHEDLKRVLMETGERKIVEHTGERQLLGGWRGWEREEHAGDCADAGEGGDFWGR
jgi:N-glycosidase YbiA